MPSLLGEKIRNLREYKGLSGEKFGSSLHPPLAKSSISMIEGGDRGLDFNQILDISETYSIDVRYFFDQIKHPDEADLNLREDPRLSPLEVIRNDIIEIKKKFKPASKIDPLCEKILTNETLYDFVKRICNWDKGMIERLGDIATGFDAGRQFADEKKERKAVNH